MPGSPLRKFVGALALAVAVVVALVVPAGYFVLGYHDRAATLDFEAHLNAARVSQYIYTHNVLWQYQQLRLSEIVQLPAGGGGPIRQKIYDADGRLVLDDGDAVAAPVLSRKASIVVSGATVGSLVAEASLRGTLIGTGFVAILSSILGLVMYLAARMLPLRALDGAVAALTHTQRDLATQNRRFDAALSNMAQGLCLFDADHRLVIVNRRFFEIFNPPPGTVVTGITLERFLAIARAVDGDPVAAAAEQQRLLAEPAGGTAVTSLADGRCISIVNRPMSGGGLVATFEDITEQRMAEERIRHLAHFDALTDLPNRVTFYERVGTILKHLRRSESLAILSVDLDHFKNVNDTLGHPIGDRLLKAVADRMRGCVRSEDIVARLGGDEFAIVQVPSGQPVGVPTLAARLIELVGAPYELEGHQVVVGVSIGIAIAPADGREPDAIMKNADLALYRAKTDGGGTYRFYELEMDARMQARRALELDLRKAVVKGEFEVFYQPIVDVKTGRVKSCEALLRWHHPERGMVGPPEFIPVAEETGLIVPIGEWVLRRACAEAARWPKQVTISVNLSPAQFKSRNLVRSVEDALEKADLDPGRLELEITELVLLEEADGAFAVLHQLRDLGIKIAMDDFGTGYSSLGYLRSFPFDKIKIDQSFIRDLPAKEDSLAIVRAVVGLSSSLGITTTAEGVETKEQFARLASEGCNEVQGFLFSPPRPASEIEPMLGELAPRTEEVA
ncbi:MAG TPA: EAL domain-containing protein [Pseudolabrys sp.]|nr:EAL domain-containing protein [Pseudolabrys sp.]